MKFTQKKNFFRDFSKCVVLLSDIKTKLKKNFRENQENFRAEVLVDDHKPFTSCYDHKRMQVIATTHYGCWNNFGYGFHSLYIVGFDWYTCKN